MFFYFLYKLGYLLANVLPIRWAYWLAERVSDIQYTLSGQDREAVTQNLTRVLGKDVEYCRRLARKVFRSFGLYLVDFFRMRRLDMKFIKRHVRIEGLEYVDSILRQNRGIVALTCHIGNWEMGGVVMAILGYKVNAVALNHSYERINRFFVRQREKQGLKVIRMGSLMKRCISVLRNKEILALLGDRDFTQSGIVVKFFGIPTSIPKGPVMLARRTHSIIIPGFFVRDGRYNYRLIFDKPIEMKDTAGSNDREIIRKETERLVPVMEKYIRFFPEQWLLFRRFWETPVDAFIL